jgi:ferritin-like metal-binding protein YciE
MMPPDRPARRAPMRLATPETARSNPEEVMADTENLQSLYIDQLRDLYSAERQILDALPKMVKRSTHRELTAALEDHRATTARQVERLERIFNTLHEKPGGEKCEGIEGILKEGSKELHQWHVEF